MAFIQTVTGRISPDQLGFCHSHEHLLMSRGMSFLRNPNLLLDDFDKSLQEVESYKAHGGNAIVEAQPVGCNRVADGLQKLSEQSGVKIVASTGFHKMFFYPEDHWIFRYTEEQMTQIFIHELTEGMYVDCDDREPVKSISAKAGQIKCALDTEGLTPQYRKLFSAALKACSSTGAPMMVHIEIGADPLELIDFIQSSGDAPEHIIFCHLDRACADLEVHKQVASHGIYLEYDTIGRFKYHSDEVETGIIGELLSAGYGDRLLISLDTTRARLKSYTPDGIGLCYILDNFIPGMRAAGITQKQVDKMTITNPQKAFAFAEG